MAGRLPPQKTAALASSMASSSFQELAAFDSIVVTPPARAGSAAAASSVAGVNPSPIAELLAAAQLWADDGGGPAGLGLGFGRGGEPLLETQHIKSTRTRLGG